jgi:predicted PurR-regulated permease PerM
MALCNGGQTSMADDSAGFPERPAGRRFVLPRDTQAILLAGILGILILYTLYFAAEIVQPIFLAFVLNLLLQPAMRLLTDWYVPRALAALVVISLLFGSVAGMGLALSGPLTEWVAKAPEGLPRIEERLRVLRKPIAALQAANAQFDKLAMTSPGNVRTVATAGQSLSGFVFTSTRTLLGALLTGVVLLFFLLSTGDMFLRRLVEIMPTLANKKQAVEISREIEANISAYLVTVSLMNLAVGVATGIAAYFCGLPDPTLWGALAFLLNYVPILGPMCGIAILFVVGLFTFDALWQAALPAAIYFVIHIIEGETVTPLLLARRFTLNPVLVILSVVVWYWMWGVVGVLLAVPMLATAKIICDRIEPLMAFGHFLGGSARD